MLVTILPPGCDTCLVGPKLLSIFPLPHPVLASSGRTCPVSMRTTASLFSPLTCNIAVFQHTNNDRLWGILSSSPRHCKPPRCDHVPENQLTTATIKLCHASLSHSKHGCKSQFILKLPFLFLVVKKEGRSGKNIYGATFPQLRKQRPGKCKIQIK